MLARLMQFGLLIAAAMLPASAEVNQSWTKLMEVLKPGKKIVVTQMKGKKLEGKLGSITQESITFTFREVVSSKGSGADQYRDASVTVQREDVFRVRIAGTRQKRTLIGLGIGTAVGAVFGSNLGSRRHGLSAVVFGGLFGGIGAAGGGAIPIGAPLYEAPGGLKRK